MKPLEATQHGISTGLSIRFGPERMRELANIARAADMSMSELCRTLIDGALAQLHAGEKAPPPTVLVRLKQRMADAPRNVEAAPAVDLGAMEERIVTRLLAAIQAAPPAAPTTPPPPPRKPRGGRS